MTVLAASKPIGICNGNVQPEQMCSSLPSSDTFKILSVAKVRHSDLCPMGTSQINNLIGRDT